MNADRAQVEALAKAFQSSPAWPVVFKADSAMLLAEVAIALIAAGHDRRVSELLEANNRYLEWARAAEARPHPEWVADLLNRRSEVEVRLRAPMLAKRKRRPLPAPLTPEELWDLANALGIPSELRHA